MLQQQEGRSKLSEESVQPEVADVPMDAAPEGQGNTPYGEYLGRLPEEVRGDVEPIFKEWDANVTKRFQEAADFRKQMEPYAELGLSDVPKEDVENLLALRELAANNPEGFDEWLRDAAMERGLLNNNPYAEDENPFAMDDEPISELDPLMSKLNELEQWKEQQEYESRVSEAMKVVEKQVEEAQTKYPDVSPELAEQFLAAYAESDPENAVELAYESAQKWISQIQQGMVKDKLEQPESAESGSKADAAPEDIRDFATASQAALARLKQSN